SWRSSSSTKRWHAVTFLFYRTNKTEAVKHELRSLERRVIDPVAALPVPANPIRAIGQVSAIHQEVPATNKERLDVETRGLQSEALYAQALGGRTGALGRLAFATPAAVLTPLAELGTQEPLTKAIRD